MNEFILKITVKIMPFWKVVKRKSEGLLALV